MQRAISNGWLDPELIAFAEEQHARLGRRKRPDLRASTRFNLRTAPTPGKRQLSRSSRGTTLRISVLGLLLSSAAFSYLAWSNTLGSLPVASVIGLALGSSDAARSPTGARSATALIPADTLRGEATDSIPASTASAGNTRPDLKEQVYQLRAENHALQLRLRKLREEVNQTAEKADQQPGQKNHTESTSSPAIALVDSAAVATGL